MDIRRANISTDVDDFFLSSICMSYYHTEHLFTTIGSLILISQVIKGVKLIQVGGGVQNPKKNFGTSAKILMMSDIAQIFRKSYQTPKLQ